MYTSGDVLVAITGSSITGTLNYIFTGNGDYTLSYLRGTWPYVSGAAFGPTNIWSTLFVPAAITWIDKIPPTLDIVFSPDGHSIVFTFSDNLPGVLAQVDGVPYVSGTPISSPWRHTFFVIDIAGNSISFSFTIIAPQPWWGWGGGGWGWGGGWWGWGWWTIGAIIETPPCLLSDVVCVGNNYIPKPGNFCDISSLYPGVCQSPTTTGEQEHPAPGPEPLSGEVSLFPYGLELTNAYLWAHGYGITTMPTIQQANMTGVLLRKHLAKMISVFAIQFMGIKPEWDKWCRFTDIDKESSETQAYAILSCQLGLMWLQEDWVTPRKTFEPNGIVNRAQFGTVLSRLLFGDTYNVKPGEETFLIKVENGVQKLVSRIGQVLWSKAPAPVLQLQWYSKHLQALKDASIMKKIDDPLMYELRWYVMLMMMRADMNGSVKPRWTGDVAETDVTI